jgi:hypothetical protein
MVSELLKRKNLHGVTSFGGWVRYKEECQPHTDAHQRFSRINYIEGEGSRTAR